MATTPPIVFCYCSRIEGLPPRQKFFRIFQFDPLNLHNSNNHTTLQPHVQFGHKTTNQPTKRTTPMTQLSLGRAELVKVIHNIHPYKTKAEIAEALSLTLDGLTSVLAAPNVTLQLRGFGAFNTKMTKERQGRNPATGEAITIPPRLAVRFKASKSLVP